VRELNLGPGLRGLLGLLGAIATIASFTVGATEVMIAIRRSLYWPSVVVALVCGTIACGGLVLMRGAWRGRIIGRSISLHRLHQGRRP